MKKIIILLSLIVAMFSFTATNVSATQAKTNNTFFNSPPIVIPTSNPDITFLVYMLPTSMHLEVRGLNTWPEGVLVYEGDIVNAGINSVLTRDLVLLVSGYGFVTVADGIHS